MIVDCAAGTLEMEPRHSVRGNPPQFPFEIRKSLQDPEADAATARLVSRKVRPVEQPDGYARPSEGPGGRRAGRPGANNQDGGSPCKLQIVRFRLQIDCRFLQRHSEIQSAICNLQSEISDFVFRYRLPRLIRFASS